ncbi:lytic transglycosylase domain-containing protein [Streptacidiphilus sp. 4-A2]|nr:lytic transglycosylase domain-containing protein [Streptacidiphilus sp. 4-A2]
MGVDGNGDGRADPQNIYDAALTAAHYLCSQERDLADPAQYTEAVLSYNDDGAYVSAVRAWAAYYRASTLAQQRPPSAQPGPPSKPKPKPQPKPGPRPGPTATPAPTTPTSPAASSRPQPKPSLPGSALPGPGAVTTPPPTLEPTPPPTLAPSPGSGPPGPSRPLRQRAR